MGLPYAGKLLAAALVVVHVWHLGKSWWENLLFFWTSLGKQFISSNNMQGSKLNHYPAVTEYVVCSQFQLMW